MRLTYAAGDYSVVSAKPWYDSRWVPLLSAVGATPATWVEATGGGGVTTPVRLYTATTACVILDRESTDNFTGAGLSAAFVVTAVTGAPIQNPTPIAATGTNGYTYLIETSVDGQVWTSAIGDLGAAPVAAAVDGSSVVITDSGQPSGALGAAGAGRRFVRFTVRYHHWLGNGVTADSVAVKVRIIAASTAPAMPALPAYSLILPASPDLNGTGADSANGVSEEEVIDDGPLPDYRIDSVVSAVHRAVEFTTDEFDQARYCTITITVKNYSGSASPSLWLNVSPSLGVRLISTQVGATRYGAGVAVGSAHQLPIPTLSPGASVVVTVRAARPVVGGRALVIFSLLNPNHSYTQGASTAAVNFDADYPEGAGRSGYTPTRVTGIVSVAP